ncbi:MAG: peptidoglycan DD-metalloendopeptidase family protein [Acidimicrobiia bacterium]|nr:peptidoglycan DD-metalloendopeptidase family protein [Acidimicrobiia bacterium]
MSSFRLPLSVRLAVFAVLAPLAATSAPAGGAGRAEPPAPRPAVEVAPAAPSLLSDEQLVATALRMDGAVAQQRQAVDGAERAEDGALVNLANLVERLDAIEAEIAELRRQAADRAVSLYMAPSDDPMEQLLVSGGDLNAAGVRRALNAVASGAGVGALERLREAQLDLEELQLLATMARDEFDTASEAARAAQIELAGVEQQRVEINSLLRARIEAFTAETSAMAGGEAKILEIIRDDASRPGGSGGRLGAAAAVAPAEPEWLSAPVAAVVTSEFGYRWGRMHKGIDFGADEGTPVAAAASGYVLYAGYTEGFGNNVIVDHGGGRTTLYAHLSSIDVDAGASVARGEYLGAVGSTGNSTGPHLHFEVRIDGEPVDPSQELG